MDKGGRRGRNIRFFVGNISVLPQLKSTVKDIQRRFGEMAADVQKLKGQGEEMSLRDFNARVGRASQPGDIIGATRGREKEHGWGRDAEVH
ncbi:unnamed protein product [Sphacelaria rigidula]